MNCSRIKKALPWALITGGFFALTPYIFTYAENQRGYKAIGGEIFFPMLPLIIWLLVTTIKDVINEFKNKNEGIEQNENQL